jgi:hypothetical protein
MLPDGGQLLGHGRAANQDLFFRSANELLLVWLRAKDVIVDLRQAYHNPLTFGDLEDAAKAMMEWLEARAPCSYEGFRKTVLGS